MNGFLFDVPFYCESDTVDYRLLCFLVVRQILWISRLLFVKYYSLSLTRPISP